MRIIMNFVDKNQIVIDNLTGESIDNILNDIMDIKDGLVRFNFPDSVEYRNFILNTRNLTNVTVENK